MEATPNPSMNGVTRPIHPHLQKIPLDQESFQEKPFQLLAAVRENSLSRIFLQTGERDMSTKIISTGRSGFFDAAYIAYHHHLPLRLKPDHVWIAILQGVSEHVNAHPDDLSMRSKLVSFTGKKDLVVNGSEPSLEAITNWSESLLSFADQIRQNVNPSVSENLKCNFTTSTQVSLTAQAVVLMNTFQEFFTYKRMVGCGLPKVFLDGTEDDWRILRKSSEGVITAVGMDWWAPFILPVLDKLLEARVSDTVDIKFWDCIYKCMPAQGSSLYWNPSAGHFHAGWINNFFPYTKRDSKVTPTSFSSSSAQVSHRNPSLKPLSTIFLIHDEYSDKLTSLTPRQALQAYKEALGGGLPNVSVPSGLCTAKVSVEQKGSGKAVGVVVVSAGFFGVCVRPVADDGRACGDDDNFDMTGKVGVHKEGEKDGKSGCKKKSGAKKGANGPERVEEELEVVPFVSWVVGKVSQAPRPCD